MEEGGGDVKETLSGARVEEKLDARGM